MDHKENQEQRECVGICMLEEPHLCKSSCVGSTRVYTEADKKSLEKIPKEDKRFIEEEKNQYHAESVSRIIMQTRRFKRSSTKSRH